MGRQRMEPLDRPGTCRRRNALEGHDRIDACGEDHKSVPAALPRAYSVDALQPPVCTSVGKERSLFNRILTAVDIEYAAPNDRILSLAAEFAGLGAQLRLIYVRFMIENAVAYIPAETLLEDEKSASRRLEELGHRAGINADRMSVASPMGRVYREIMRAADDFEADLILVGPHSPSMAKYLIGADASRILTHASVSVLVAR